MALLPRRKRPVLPPPLKPQDYIVLRYGIPLPKSYGETLFSEDWNYLQSIMFYFYMIKYFLPIKIKFPTVLEGIISIKPNIGKLIEREIRVPGSYRISHVAWYTTKSPLSYRTAGATWSRRVEPITTSIKRASEILDIIKISNNLASESSGNVRPLSIVSTRATISVPLKTKEAEPLWSSLYVKRSYDTQTGQSTGPLELNITSGKNTLIRQRELYITSSFTRLLPPSKTEIKSATRTLQTKPPTTEIKGATKTLQTKTPTVSMKTASTRITKAPPNVLVKQTTKSLKLVSFSLYYEVRSSA